MSDAMYGLLMVGGLIGVSALIYGAAWWIGERRYRAHLKRCEAGERWPPMPGPIPPPPPAPRHREPVASVPSPFYQEPPAPWPVWTIHDVPDAHSVAPEVQSYSAGGGESGGGGASGSWSDSGSSSSDCGSGSSDSGGSCGSGE